MIHQILLTTLILFGVSNGGLIDKSTIFLSNEKTIEAPIKETTTQQDDGTYTYSYYTSWSQQYSAYNNWYIQDNNNYILRGYREDTQLTNNIIHYKANFYHTLLTSDINTSSLTQNWPNAAWVSTGQEYQTNKTSTASMAIYQIEPFNFTYDNETTIYLNNYITYNYDGQLTFKKIVLQTFEDLSTYMDLTTFVTPYSINEYYTQIINPANGYQYSKEETLLKVNSSYTDDSGKVFVSDKTELQPLADKKTYIIIFYLLLNEIQENTTGQNQNFWTTNKIRSLQGYRTQITGTFIPPINDYEVVDLPNLLFTILTLPFSFISQAFNLTLFPGTMYQLNLSNLFLAFIGIMIFVFIVKILIGKMK